MIEIEDKIISDDLFLKQFVCDLQKCKGACCVEGDSGAPLSNQEATLIKDNLSVIKPYMKEDGVNTVVENGVFYIDQDGDQVTTLVNGKECAFVFFDKNNIAKCSIEAAYKKGEINFNKPISCHLYPIRVKNYEKFQAINVDKWHVCKPACNCGKKLNIPVFKFLKQAIVRMWGEDFYNDLDVVNNQFFNSNNTDK
tara:strand:- start:4516 stop:5103 length:588 start_codon:yes stop_codon:yes gene_type:complete